MSTQHSLPAEYAGFVDDAAIFPPGNAPLEAAVEAYRSHVDQPWAELVGPFLVSDTRLPDLAALVGSDAAGNPDRQDPLPVAVVVSGGAGALEPAVRWCERSPALRLGGVEIALRDLDDLAGAARRVTTAASQLALETPLSVEVPLLHAGTPGWLAALDELAAADVRLKLRTGGEEALAFPPAASLAAALDDALDRELSFKCTAGLHHAVRHRDLETGFMHHGFLNILLATRVAWDGGSADEVVATLEEQDATTVVTRLRETGSEALQRTRRLFVSFGCCGVQDPWNDLVTLGLVDEG